MTFTDEDDAQRFIRMLDVFDGDGDKATAAVGGAKMAVMTVRQVMLSYVDANPRAAAAQRAKYRNQIRDHFDDALGHTPINDVDVVLAWVGRMLGKQQGKANPRVRATPVRPIRAKTAPVQVHSLAPKTIRNLHGLLSASMEWAVQRHLRADNPGKGVLLPKIETVGDEIRIRRDRPRGSRQENIGLGFRVVGELSASEHAGLDAIGHTHLKCGTVKSRG